MTMTRFSYFSECLQFAYFFLVGHRAKIQRQKFEGGWVVQASNEVIRRRA